MTQKQKINELEETIGQQAEELASLDKLRNVNLDDPTNANDFASSLQQEILNKKLLYKALTQHNECSDADEREILRRFIGQPPETRRTKFEDFKQGLKRIQSDLEARGGSIKDSNELINQNELLKTLKFKYDENGLRSLYWNMPLIQHIDIFQAKQTLDQTTIIKSLINRYCRQLDNLNQANINYKTIIDTSTEIPLMLGNRKDFEAFFEDTKKQIKEVQDLGNLILTDYLNSNNIGKIYEVQLEKDENGNTKGVRYETNTNKMLEDLADFRDKVIRFHPESLTLKFAELLATLKKPLEI